MQKIIVSKEQLTSICHEMYSLGRESQQVAPKSPLHVESYIKGVIRGIEISVPEELYPKEVCPTGDGPYVVPNPVRQRK